MIEQIKQAQQQLGDLIQTIRFEDIDNFGAQAQNIAKHAFNDGNWPEDLPPWPLVRIQSSEIHIIRGRLIEALKQGVRGYLSLDRRIGDVWLRRLFNFLQSLLRILAFNASCEDPLFPAEPQLVDIFHAYLYELTRGTNEVFGVQIKYAHTIQAWYSDFMQNVGPPLPGTRVFARRFKTAQSKLLLWAGLDEDKGITLSS
jgi:hypothetical protein